MYSPEVPQKSEFYEQFVPNKMTSSLQPSFINHPDYTDYQSGPPLNIYNNYNSNYHHHHYYYPNFDNYQGYQNALDHNWIRKFDCESHKEFFTASTPSPIECCDFEVPQQQPSNLLRPSKPFNDAEKFFVDTPKSNKVNLNNNFLDSWESEKSKISKDDEKNKSLEKECKSPKSDEYGERNI